MASFAVMNGNLVTNIIVTEDKEACETALKCTLIEFTRDNPAGAGWTYDFETGKFVAPPVEEETDADA